MKTGNDGYVAEAKLRRKKNTESFRDFGQAIQDLYRRAYPDNAESVQESSMKTFMDNCSEVDDFRLAVKKDKAGNSAGSSNSRHAGRMHPC